MRCKKPTQHQVEIGLDYLVTKVIENMGDKREFYLERFKKALETFQSAGYDTKSYRGLYEELK